MFTEVLDPAVARTELFRDGAPPRSAWARRGLRLFAVSLTAAPAGGTAGGTAASTAARGGLPRRR